MSQQETRQGRFFLYPKQAQFLDSTATFRGFVGGRGCGKSKIGAYDLIRRSRPGKLYLVAAPTYSMMQDATLRSFKEVAQQIGMEESPDPRDGYALARPDKPHVTLWNGAEILFRSAEDPEKLRGPNLAGSWLDEASQMEFLAFQNVTGALRDDRGQLGWLSATFTPQGREHWTYRVFGPDPQTGKARQNTALIHARTTDNPFLDESVYESISLQYSGLRADQELGGEFVSVEGAEWPPEYFDWPGFWFDEWPSSLTIKTMALDPSKGKGDSKGPKSKSAEERRDYSAFVLLGRDGNGQLWCEADLDNVRDVHKIVSDGLALGRSFKPDGFAVEGNAFQFMLRIEFERLSKARGVMLPVWTLDNTGDKMMRIRRLTPYLQRRNIHFRRTKGTHMLVEQLQAFPEGAHDDGPDALEMALRLMVDLWNQRNTAQPQRVRV